MGLFPNRFNGKAATLRDHRTSSRGELISVGPSRNHRQSDTSREDEHNRTSEGRTPTQIWTTEAVVPSLSDRGSTPSPPVVSRASQDGDQHQTQSSSYDGGIVSNSTLYKREIRTPFTETSFSFGQTQASREMTTPSKSRAVSLASPVGIEPQIQTSEARMSSGVPDISFASAKSASAEMTIVMNDPYQMEALSETLQEADDLIFNYGRFKEQPPFLEATSAVDQQRRPRKSRAEKLDPSNRSPSQRTYVFDAEPWMLEEFGERIIQRFRR